MPSEPYRLPVTIASVPVVAPEVELYYPRVQCLPDTAIEQQINRIIYDQFCDIIQQQGYYEDPSKTTMNGIFELKNNQRGILSLSQSNYTYIYQHANGLTIIKSLTFDVRTGKSYTLGELFKPNSNYVQRISDIIKVQLKERQISTLEPFTAIKPNQDFYIADKALIVYFQMYEITARVYGLPAFPISIYQLQDIIDEDGPLGKMLGN